MKAEELKQKSADDLKNLLRETKEKLVQLKFNLASGKVKNVREIRMAKKDIARILTVISQKIK